MQKTTKKKNRQREKKTRETQAIEKRWELNGFVMDLSSFSPVNM